MTEGSSATASRRQNPARGSAHGRAISERPFHALLLPAYPILLLYADNVVEIAPTEVLIPLFAVVGVAALLLAFVARALRSWARAGLVVVATVMPFLVAGLVAATLEPNWPDDFLLRLHMLIVAGWVAITAMGVYAALKLGSSLVSVTQLLNVVSVVLIVLATFPLVDDLRPAQSPQVDDAFLVAHTSPAGSRTGDVSARDIYHLVFDRYGSERSLLLGHGIDNSDFVDWLREHGFEVVDDARANFERTVLSLSSVHHMSLHEDLVDSGQPSYDALVDRIRSSRGVSTFKGLGYDYVLAGSWWGPSAYSRLADRTIEPRFVMSFGSALADRSVLPSLEAIAAFITTGSIDGSERQVADMTENQFRSLGSLVGQRGPKLVFAHFLVPHDPYVFLADGTIDGDTASYETQLRYTNEQLKRLIEPLLELPPEEQPIIILQADEGPYPDRYGDGRDAFDWTTASDEELVTKFGVLDAFYLPGPEGDPPLRRGLSLVNTYPEILRRYHGIELQPVADRTFGMVSGDYYDLVDITNRTDAAFERLVPPTEEESAD